MSDLRTLINLAEKYSSDNIALLRYMKNDQFDPYASWYFVCQWLEDNDCLELVSEIVRHPVESDDDIRELEPEIFYKLPENIQKACGEWVIDYLMQQHPEEAPTTAHMSLSRNQLLPRNTWLIHFSNNAESIAYNGFKYGIDQMDQLGLTTYKSDSEKAYGGYNFAFTAGGRYSRYAAAQGKYGRDAVMFQNSGVMAFHSGDEEEQIMFHGTDVDPRNIVLIKNDPYEGWQVMSARQKNVRNSGRPVFKGEFEQCEAWVMKHFAQYRKALTGF